MAEGEPDGKGFDLKELATKKIGPLPAVAWLAIAIAVFWYVRKKQGSGATGGQQTDPAGNVGTIDPQTGYVYGSQQDQAALNSGSSGLGTSSDSGTGGSTVAGSYADNNAWAVAAINYLVSIGVDATEANTSITQFLGSQKLTTQQQANVNLVIQRIGAPPSPPEPGGSVTPVVNPPGTSTYATNPPSGFTTTSTGNGSIGAKWNATTNAASYTMSWGTTAAATDGTTTVSTATATATGLKANTLYHLKVQANPAKTGAPYATLTKSTDKIKWPGGSQKPPASGGGTSGGGKSEPERYTVKKGDTFSGIASAHHYSRGGHALWVYNYTSSPHTAAAKATIKKRGPNLLEVGETVYIPKG